MCVVCCMLAAQIDKLSSKQQRMSKQKTLFNFFKKVPSSENNSSDESKSPKVHEFASPKPVLDSASKISTSSENYDVYEIVWAKLDGYPWWPAIVCQDPDTRKHVKKSQIHVQFFDQPPSRSWVNKITCIVPYNINSDADKRSPVKCSASDRDKLKIALAEADAACKIKKDNRDTLLVDFSSSPGDQDSPGTDKENTDPPSPKKAKVLLFDSEDSGDEYKPGKDDKSDEEDDTSPEASEEENEESSEVDLDISEEENQKRKRKRKPEMKTPNRKRKKLSVPSTPVNGLGVVSSPSTPTTPRSVSSATLQKISAFKTGNTSAATEGSKTVEGNWPHLKLPFIQPDKIMDKKRRRPDHPEYDPKTLYVPEEHKNQCSPGMRQWWELKSEHWDCILCFKVGKFYELYHMDAVTGVSELSLSFMRGEFAHSGFPEIAYGRFSTILVQKGYKVARVEQMETPEMMAERCKNTPGRNSKFDKVVQREVCQVASKGTLSYNVMEGDAADPQTNFLLALTEKDSCYGVCFVDASIGVFHMGQFQDDKYLSRLRTLLSHCAPAEVIYEKKMLSDKSLQLLSSILAGVLLQPLQSETEFWSASKTLNVLAAREELLGSDGRVEWPATISRFISQSDALGLTPADDGQLALRALGAVIGYLQRSFLDSQLLSMKQFKEYDPVDFSKQAAGHLLVLDDVTLTNLEVLKNSRGGSNGTLFAKLDHCCTFSGKRLLRQWLCAPLTDVAAIRKRQEAVEELLGLPVLTTELRECFKTIPDLERLIAKIHSQGNAITNKNHPDSRAIFFEEKTYSKRKIHDFLLAISGFQKLQKAMNILKKEDLKSSVLKKMSCCPDLTPTLNYFKDAFDHDLAKTEGKIVPKSSGVDADYDAAVEEIKVIEKELQDYLKKQCAYFGVQVKYFGTEKNRFQLEVAEGAAKKAGSAYETSSTRKGFQRFTTKETKEFLKRQMQAEDARTAALRDLCRRIFAKFGEKYDDYSQATMYMAELDVLQSFAEYSRSDGQTCVPEFEDSDKSPFIAIESGRHPCIPVSDGFIPNSTELGTEQWRSLVLLTGPNMGGKSTLLRQLGLHVIMAHVGCRLPALSARLSSVDRVFTRIGAGDDILAGESTFYQELSETGLIIQHATKKSVVLVDELGRGTSTYDGTAIAHAVLEELVARGCRTLFSTHYHSLVEELNTDRVSLGHMACLAENDTITFLYQFSTGACPSSHGFHAARLAGLPEHIIQLGQQKAEQLVKETMKRQLFRRICKTEAVSKDLTELAAAIEKVL